MWLQEDSIFKHLHCWSIFYTPPPPPPCLCKCVLFHCCVSLHKNSTTSWVRQMFYCRARQLLKWLASIWVHVLQLAATAEPGQSISMRRIGLEWERWRMGRRLLNRIWQWITLLLFPKGRRHTVDRRQWRVQVRGLQHYWHTVASKKAYQHWNANKKVGLPCSPSS